MGGDFQFAVEDDADVSWGGFARVLEAFEELGVAFVEEPGEVACHRGELGVDIAFDADGKGLGFFGRLIFGGGLREKREEYRQKHMLTFDEGEASFL